MNSGCCIVSHAAMTQQRGYITEASGETAADQTDIILISKQGYKTPDRRKLYESRNLVGYWLPILLYR